MEHDSQRARGEVSGTMHGSEVWRLSGGVGVEKTWLRVLRRCAPRRTAVKWGNRTRVIAGLFPSAMGTIDSGPGIVEPRLVEW